MHKSVANSSECKLFLSIMNSERHLFVFFFEDVFFLFKIYVIYADFMWCSYLYTWLYKRISIWPLLTNMFLYVGKFLRGSVAKISCSKPALYFFKFINIGLVEKLIFLNKLITTRYIAKPSHCEFSWFDSIFRCAWLTVSRPSKTSSGMVVRPPLFHSSSDTVPSES